MAITNAQQYKQLVNPPMKGNKRPGYRGDDAARAASARGNMEGRASPPSGTPQGDGPKTDAPSIEMINEIRRQNLEKAPDVKEEPKFNILDFIPGIGTVRRIASMFGPIDNREFFQQKVVPAGRLDTSKYKNFDDYMKARQAGLIDAYGNPIDQDNDNDIILPVDTTFAQIPSNMDQETDTTEEDEGLRLAFRADGGIMGGLADGQMDEMGRQMYGLGKLVKKVTRAVKKVAKSPIGKVALLYAGTGALGNLATGSGLGGMFKGIMSPTSFVSRSKLGSIFSGGGLKNIFLGAEGVPQLGLKGSSGLLGFGGKLSPFKAITAASAIAGALTPEQEEQAQQLADETGFSIEEARNSILQAAKENYAMDFRARGFKADGGLMRLGFDTAGAVMSKEDMEKLSNDPLYKGFKKMYGVSPDMAKENKSYKDKFEQFEQLFKKGYQEGGNVEPVAKKTMPLLDMDGKEKDYRETGGFVDMGRMERADDVPARLSKNEFVFTADAVRNAGDGDVDKGAEVMYNMMKNLESGGDVSEESQGLEGARRMFQTSQRLEEVL